MASTVSQEHLKSRYSKRTTDDTSVREILETFAPPKEDQTGIHLVTFGPQHHFLVIQGPEATFLCNKLLDYANALHETAEDAK